MDEIDDLSELYPDSEFSDDADSDEAYVGEIANDANVDFNVDETQSVEIRPVRKSNVKNRLVRSIDTSLEEKNYEPVIVSERIEHYKSYMSRPTKKNDGDPIMWTTEPPPPQGRQSTENLIFGKVGVKRYARSAKIELDCWELFYSQDIMDEIVMHTNAKLTTNHEGEINSTHTVTPQRKHLDSLTTLKWLQRIYSGYLHFL